MKYKISKDRIKGFMKYGIAVLGDVMVDKWVRGSITRISPEAPVPIVNKVSESSTRGGAANVSSNITSLGGMPLLFGVIGDEPHSFFANSLDLGCLYVCEGRPTTTKTRIIADGKHILRMDEESAEPISDEAFRYLLYQLGLILDTVDALVLADYAKGVLTTTKHVQKVMKLAAKYGVPVIVDPKTKSVSKYYGAAVLTPNEKELSLISGLPTETDEEVEKAVRKSNLLRIANRVLVKRGEKGMVLFSDKKKVLFKAVAPHVVDATGAGDTVTAALAMGEVALFSPEESAFFASLAASIAVQKHGTATVSAEEILDLL